MTIEIEYVPGRTETVIEYTHSPEETDTILGSVNDSHNRDDLYQVEREITVTEECYRVVTAPAKGSKSWFYMVKQNDEGDWEVTKRTQTHGRMNHVLNKRPQSTEAVRNALLEEHGVKVIN